MNTGRHVSYSVYFEVTLYGESAMKITAKELRTRTREILDSVDRGEHVTITYRGKDKAQLTSINKDEKIHEKDQSNKLPVFGMWADRNDITGVQQYVRRLRKGRFHVD